MEMMDLALWRWSAAAQLVSATITAVFFAAFARSFPTPAVRRWRNAWFWNLGAMVVTFVYWRWNPETRLQHGVLSALYIVTKGMFALQIVEGAWLSGGGDSARWTERARTMAIGAFAVAGGFLLPNLPLLGVFIQGAVAIILAIGASNVLRGQFGATVWLGAGMVIRGAFAAVESIVYAASAPTPLLSLPFSSELLSRYLASSSSFDAVAEWLLALGCVLVVGVRSRDELATTNTELLAAQDQLRKLVDVDSLTGLANRRALPAALRAVQPVGAGVVFIDLRGFKDINDARGHAAGDAALVRFADALRECFRPEDFVLRYAGDEFVVVAPGLSRDAMMARLDALRARLSVSAGATPPIEFDAGFAALQEGGLPDEVLRAADDAMYQSKQRARLTPLHLRAVSDSRSGHSG
jgi:diguanylate cyclase (GGDEF)-like protein